jgi:hypothetical protein
LFGPIDRLLHPRSKRELDGIESAGPEPQARRASDAELAAGLGMPFHPMTEWAGRNAEGEGVIGFTNEELGELVADRERRLRGG